MNLIRRILGKILHIVHSLISKFLVSRGVILMLHWIGDESLDDIHEPFRISTYQFQKLINWLEKINCIRLENWENEYNFYALTIDDVPENFYYNAFPLLKEKKIPFTIFVNISLLDTSGYISSEQLIEMSKCDSCTIGSHGMTHGEYYKLSKTQAMDELSRSKEKLEELINRPVEMYAFPFGSYYSCGFANKRLALKNYKYGFSTIHCSVTKPLFLRKYFIPRINVNKDFINLL